jgi:hypothetical protein
MLPSRVVVARARSLLSLSYSRARSLSLPYGGVNLTNPVE